MALMFVRPLILAVMAMAWPMTVAASVVFPSDTQWKYFPGVSEPSQGDTAAWRVSGFDDASWATGQAPFYYEDQPGSGNALSGNTQLGDMRGNYSCIFLRKAFVVDDPKDISELRLVGWCDDGFIAWINGAEITRFNVPAGAIPFNGFSQPALSEPVPEVTTVLSQADAHLVKGTNVIAVQAFNSGLANSSDFGIALALSSSVDDRPPLVEMLVPTANALVQKLTQVEVGFNEDVAGVDASDLLVNGVPASSMTAFSGAQYVFNFPQPAEGIVNLTWAAGHGIHDLASAANPFSGDAWSYTLDPNAAPPGLLISEFMADNDNTLNDEDGDSSDWIEIFNAGSTSASLYGYSLTTRSNTVQWRLPNTSLLPNTYLVVFASEKNRTNAGSPLHTNFKLAKEGGYLALLDTEGKPISEFVSYPSQFTDVSYGRDRGNPSILAYFPKPTPNTANVGGGPAFSPAVKFSRPAGAFLAPFNVELSTETAGASIRYTLDGSLPSQTSALYSAPIPINSTVQVRAMSFAPGLLPGPIESHTYLLLDPNVTSFSSDLPVIVIHNFTGGRVPAGTRQFANISVFEPGFGRTSLTNKPTLSTRAGINLRGSSTMYQPKSNFRVEFWDEYDDDQHHSLLGMPEEADWILYAPNNFEPVLIHNKFIHDLSRDVGRYSPRARFVEVFVNTAGGAVTSGNYNGVYVLLERIKRGPDRVDIDALQPEHSKPPRVTGGYLMSVDRGAPDEGQLYGGGLGVNAQDPKWDEITQPQRSAQYQYITEFLDTMLNALNSPDFADPVNGYAKYVDVAAAIDHHILNVLAFNVDALRLSGYFYKPREGKLTFGPLWDFDRALGSTDGRDSNPRVWRSTSGDRGTDMFNPDWIFSNPWYSPMFRDPDFWQRWIDRWQELRRNEFALTNLHGLVDALANQVREAQAREVARWPGFTSPRYGSYQGEVNHMKTWLADRVDFIDTNFLAAPLLSLPGGPLASGTTISLSGSAGATIYYTLDGTDPRAPGGEISQSALTYSGPLSVIRNTRITARARDLKHKNLTGESKPPLSSPWSGPMAATYIVSTPTLAVTELMYHPSETSGSDLDLLEFVELKNTGSQAVALPGFRFTQGIDYTFTTESGVTSLGPGEFAVLVKNRVAFSARYPGVSNIAGEYLGSLDNRGEQIVLEGPAQESVFDLGYQNQWYPPTDGAGFSLVAVDESSATRPGSHRSSWRVSAAMGGSPGVADPVPPSIPPILVNEALTHTDPPNVDAVELLNPTQADVTLGGWFLSDDVSQPMKFRIPTETIIPRGGYLILDETQFNSGADAFALGSMGDEIYLFSGSEAGLTGYSHGFKFGAAANGVTFGRYVTSEGKEEFTAQARPTLGQANAGPAVPPVAITEVMFDPAPLGGANNARDEFIEIYNATQQPVALYDPSFPANTWRIGGGVEFTFPQNTILAPAESLLLVSFDPSVDPAGLAGFLAAYQLNVDQVKIFGPYKGLLNNANDHVALLKPDPPEPAPSPDAGIVPYVLFDEVSFASEAPWPTDASGTGKSIHRISVAAYGDDPVNWISGAPSPGRVTSSDPVDGDQDGLPDAWELAHGLNPQSASGDNGANGDPDGDGLTNLQEFAAGTDPTNAGSALQVQGVWIENGSCALQFRALAGKSYSVLYRDSLTTGAWTRLADVPPPEASSLQKVTDTGFPGNAARFYKLVTPAMP